MPKKKKSKKRGNIANFHCFPWFFKICQTNIIFTKISYLFNNFKKSKNIKKKIKDNLRISINSKEFQNICEKYIPKRIQKQKYRRRRTNICVTIWFCTF